VIGRRFPAEETKQGEQFGRWRLFNFLRRLADFASLSAGRRRIEVCHVEQLTPEEKLSKADILSDLEAS
jgi:hypothetical protein